MLQYNQMPFSFSHPSSCRHIKALKSSNEICRHQQRSLMGAVGSAERHMVVSTMDSEISHLSSSVSGTFPY